MTSRATVFAALITAGLMTGISADPQTAPAQITQQAQVELSDWKCRSELRDKVTATGGAPTFIRISAGVLAAFVSKRVLPEVHDLNIGSEQQVLVQILVDHQGEVACARNLDLPQSSSNPILMSKSLDAARKWQFRPYYLNKQPVIVEATMTFRYKGSKISTQP
jgi:hypothetical protein